MTMVQKLLDINLFGACSVAGVRSGSFMLTGAKHKALFALLVTAPFGRRTRSFLQETLWGTACYDTGRQSLRRALADIKAIIGDCYGELLSSSNSEITINLARVNFIGHPGQGPFLEGISIRETGFLQWLEGIRQNPAQLAGLFSLTSQNQVHPVLPTVAILPFRAISMEANDITLGDWLAEETCRSLSRSRLLAVISHLSCREIARGIVDIQHVRAVLMIDFCVAGSLRRVGGMLVLDADLIDARSGRILWTRQFTGPSRQFTGLMAEGVATIVQSIGAAIADDALTHIQGLLPAEIEDHQLLIAGVNLMHKLRLSEFARARELIEEARIRAPHTPEIHAWLGKWYVLSIFNGWSTDPARETQFAIDCTARALDLSPDNAFCLTIDGFVQNNLLRRLDVADQRYSAALAANPSSALSWLLKGVLHAFNDEGAEAVAATARARRLSPIDPFGYFYDSLNATAHLATGQFETALTLADRSIAANDRHISTLRTRIVALNGLDRIAEARETATEILRRMPDFTVSGYLRTHPAAENAFGRNAAQAFLKAGIPQD
jgi:TolB-like protein